MSEYTSQVLGQNLTLALQQRRLHDAGEISRVIIQSPNVDPLLLKMAQQILQGLEQKGITEQTAIQSDLLQLKQTFDQPTPDECKVPGSFPMPNGGCPEEHIELDSSNRGRKCCLPLKKLREDLKQGPVAFFESTMKADAQEAAPTVTSTAASVAPWTPTPLWGTSNRSSWNQSVFQSSVNNAVATPEIMGEFVERFGIYDHPKVSSWVRQQPPLPADQQRILDKQHATTLEDQRMVFSGTIPSKKQKIVETSLESQGHAVEHAIKKEEEKPDGGQPWSIVGMSSELWQYMKAKFNGTINFLKWMKSNDWAKWYWVLQCIKIVLSLVCLLWQYKKPVEVLLSVWNSGQLLMIGGAGALGIGFTFLAPLVIYFCVGYIKRFFLSVLAGNALVQAFSAAVSSEFYSYFTYAFIAWHWVSLVLNGVFFIELVSLILEIIGASTFAFQSNSQKDSLMNLFLTDDVFDTDKTTGKPTNQFKGVELKDTPDFNQPSMAGPPGPPDFKTVEQMSAMEKFMFHLCNSKFINVAGMAQGLCVNILQLMEEMFCMFLTQWLKSLPIVFQNIGTGYCWVTKQVTTIATKLIEYYNNNISFANLFSNPFSIPVKMAEVTASQIPLSDFMNFLTTSVQTVVDFFKLPGITEAYKSFMSIWQTTTAT